MKIDEEKVLKWLLPLLLPLFTTLIYILISYHSTTAAKCNPDDESGLLAFKSGIKADPSGFLLSWKPGTDCCSTWFGISCSQSKPPNRVTGISLTGQPENSTQILSGTISPALSKLQYLTSISFFNLRNLSGPFPSFLLNLPNLVIVYIENNKLSGPLPQNIGILSKLVAFSVKGNRFSGPIPSSFGLMTQVTQLVLGGNLFTGNIPFSIGNITELSYLSLEENQLTGTIPDFFAGLTNLRIFNVSYNKLTGNIPASITTVATVLQYLEAGHNSLTGQIPDFLGKFHALDTLDLSWNQFQGIVPKSFVNLTKIFNLDLSHNSLTDPFPDMKVIGIESLDLSYNQFHLGEIPVWVTSSPIIYSLKLAKCGINIKLDNWKPLETYFYDYIDLSENEITGSPVQLLNRTDYLVGFYASGNKLNFSLESIKLPPTLKYLDLSRNSVYGKVPGGVSLLNNLNVSYNHLCGQLPKTTFSASAFAGNDCLCGSPLPQCKA